MVASHSCIPNILSSLDHTIKLSTYRKPTNTNWYLDKNSNQPSRKTRKAIIHSLVYRAENICSTPEILDKDMEYLYSVLLKNGFYQDRMIKEPEKKLPTLIINPDTGLRVKKIVHLSYVPGLSEELRRIF